MERIFPSGERFILRCAARNVITAEWNAARAGNVISRSEYGKLRRHWETSRIFSGESPCSRRLLHFFGESTFPFSFQSSFFFLFFHFSMCSLAFVLGPVTVPPLCPRHKRVYAYKSSLFTPRIELKLNFFPSTLAKKRWGEGGAWIGAVCALSSSPPLSPRMESRSDTGGNRVEIQESASLQLGSDVTKFRVAAAEVGRHFVSSSEHRDSRAGISHIAHTGQYIWARFFCVSFFSPSTGKILPSRLWRCHRQTHFVARGKLKFLTTILSWCSWRSWEIFGS